MKQLEAATPNDKRRFRQMLFDYAPRSLGALVFFTGAVLLIMSATPTEIAGSKGLFEKLLGEVPNYVSVLEGLALMGVAVGLFRRMQVAYYASGGLLLVGFATTLAHAPGPLYTGLFGGALIALIAARSAFFRRSNLSAMRPGGLWFLAASLVVTLAAIGAALWAGHKAGFIEAEWWDLILHPVIGAAGRPVFLAAALLAGLAFITLVAAPATPRLPLPLNADFARVRDILATAEAPRPESVLAYAGDKSFLFSPSGKSFLMYAASANTLVAMGGPIGRSDEAVSLLQAFHVLAERQGVSPAVYAAPTEALPALLETGFAVEKIGENAVLDLATFSLSGRKREVIRRGRRKLAERKGATFQICLAPHPAGILERLKPVSDAWLSENNGTEKSFSLGRFDPDFFAHCPLGIVEIEGEVVAFGSLWTVPDKGWSGIDLMRYDPGKAVTNTMDFLLVELILWAQREGYRQFDLSMAPLSGLAREGERPLLARVGQMIFDHGERFYNFKGLRRFKQKFNPQWEPRYIAAATRLALPIALADAAVLTNGSFLGNSAGGDRKPA